MWHSLPMLLRRVSVVVVVVAGVLAVTATSEVGDPGIPVTSPQKSIQLTLDAGRPSARFFVDIDDTLVDRGELTLRAEINVADDDAADDDTDGVAVIDVGLVAEGDALPDDVDVAGDASLASVKEGSFGVERFPAEGRAVLAVRLRDGVDRAAVGFVLTASASVPVAPEADQHLLVSVSPDTTFDAGDDAP